MGQCPSSVRYLDYPPYYFIVSIVSSRCQDPSQNSASSHPVARYDSSVEVVRFPFPEAAGVARWGPGQTGVQATMWGPLGEHFG